MKPSLCCLLAVLLIGLVPVADAQVTRDPVSDEDRASFRVLYHDKLTSVQRTPTIKDDLKLAQDMMDFARGSVDSRILAVYILYSAWFLFAAVRVVESRRA